MDQTADFRAQQSVLAPVGKVASVVAAQADIPAVAVADTRVAVPAAMADPAAVAPSMAVQTRSIQQP